MRMRQRVFSGGMALLVAIVLAEMPEGQTISQSQQPPRPGVPGPATPGERTAPPPETPQRPANPPQPGAQQTGAPPLVANAYESTYKPFPSRTTLIRNATILT